MINKMTGVRGLYAKTSTVGCPGYIAHVIVRGIEKRNAA